MPEAAAVSALAVTLGLALRRPRLPFGLRIGPGIAAAVGVLILLIAGGIHRPDVIDALDVLWRPLATLAAIMVMTGVAARVGLFNQLATIVVARAGPEAGASRLFALVFTLSFATAAVFNNDAAILVLTPAVVVLVRALYPDTPSLLLPFAFAVFMAAGVAPFLTSNPMNTVVAGAADIDFNVYAMRMVPVALTTAVVTFLVLRRIFARELAAAPPAAAQPPAGCWTAAQRNSLALVLVVLVAYPVFALAGLHVFVVAAAGAVLALALAWRYGAGRPPEVLRDAIAWEILVFMLGMFMLAKGLQNVGIVDPLRELYEWGGMAAIGGISAIGSALINNHSMALTNLLVIQEIAGAGDDAYLAALVGGDLGPRLLPIGSLAGLMWLTLLGRLGVDVPLHRFVMVGTIVTIPSLAASLTVLALL